MIELMLTEEQCKHLAFAVLEQVASLHGSYEAHEPEVQDAIRHLEAVQRTLDRLGNGRPA
jgi:phage shock protein A